MFDLSIGDVARRARMSPSTIRYYERVGILPKPARVAGRRRYDESILERLAMVTLAKWMGFTVSEITMLLGGSIGRPPPERWRKLAHAKLVEVEKLVAHAFAVRQMLLDTLDQKCPKLVERGLSIPNVSQRSAHGPGRSGIRSR